MLPSAHVLVRVEAYGSGTVGEGATVGIRGCKQAHTAGEGWHRDSEQSTGLCGSGVMELSKASTASFPGALGLALLTKVKGYGDDGE